MGNITKIEESTNGTTFTTTAYYKYDENNQLCYESNAKTVLTREYTYDDGGNIVSIEEWDTFKAPTLSEVEVIIPTPAPVITGRVTATNGLNLPAARGRAMES